MRIPFHPINIRIQSSSYSSLLASAIVKLSNLFLLYIELFPSFSREEERRRERAGGDGGERGEGWMMFLSAGTIPDGKRRKINNKTRRADASSDALDGILSLSLSLLGLSAQQRERTKKTAGLLS